jgi:hypothetical protein
VNLFQGLEGTRCRRQRGTNKNFIYSPCPALSKIQFLDLLFTSVVTNYEDNSQGAGPEDSRCGPENCTGQVSGGAAGESGGGSYQVYCSEKKKKPSSFLAVPAGEDGVLSINKRGSSDALEWKRTEQEVSKNQQGIKTDYRYECVSKKV